MNLFELFEADTYQPPSIDVGDSILIGKFKNRKAKVTGFKKDDNNQPVLKTTKGDQKLFKPRIPKLMDENEQYDASGHSIETMRDRYNYGRCMYLALALHDMFGWKIRGEITNDRYVHIWAVNPQGKAVDINGVHSGQDITHIDKSRSSPKNEIVDIDPEELRASYGTIVQAERIVRANPDHFGVKLNEITESSVLENPAFKSWFRPRIPKLMEETHEKTIPQYLYKWVSAGQFDKYLEKGMLPPKRRYSHFIDGKFVAGNSFTDAAHIDKWSHAESSTMLIRIDTDKIPNKIHAIPGNKTYLRTMGMTSDVHDPKAWEMESDEIDEYWIEGTLNLKLANAKVIKKTSPKSKSLKEATFKAYHGSNSKIEGDFDEKLIGTGIDSSPFVGGVGMLGKGFYFTPSERKAADYGEHVVEAELTINNPLMIGKGAEFDSIHDAVNSIAGREVYRREFQDVLRKAGYDGIVKRDYYYPELDEIVVFDPKQIVIARKITEKVTFPAFSPAFKKWFGDSKVVDAEGNPLVVYHNTHADFDTFNPLLGNFGIHFGSAEQANDINKNPVAKMERNPNFRPRILPVYLSIQNPISLPDLEWWGFDNVMEELRNRGIRVYPPSYREKEEDEDDDMNTKEQVEALINALQRHGYDGVVYQNRHEGKTVGGGDSWIAFDSRQVKSAIGNKGSFNRNDPRIQEAAPLRYHGTQASHDLNYRLRDNLKLKDDDHAAIKELDAMIAPLDQDMVLWRGVKSGFSAVKVGATIRDAGYVSASTSVDQAKVFALGDGAAMLRISVKKGTPVIDLRDWEGENEIVIPRGAVFRVDEIIERPGRVPTILLTVV